MAGSSFKNQGTTDETIFKSLTACIITFSIVTYVLADSPSLGEPQSQRLPFRVFRRKILSGRTPIHQCINIPIHCKYNMGAPSVTINMTMAHEHGLS